MGWMQAVQNVTAGELLNIDGKTLRGAKEAGNFRSLIQMVSVWSASQRLVLGQTKVSEKSNEITAIPPLLELLAIRGCLVSIAAAIAPRFPRRALHQADAMGCQTEIAKTIVEQGADYVLALKGNQNDIVPFLVENARFFGLVKAQRKRHRYSRPQSLDIWASFLS
jgi:predicted transposase YbfD/YdcC